ncbi:MAG: MFS transporter [Pseudomonadales bacterium]|jgi:DHA1 family bicyclomycin/chloramphenicol resistance-like MFS transporter|nr:MFS transporter [Pseudomonadales bacterium]
MRHAIALILTLALLSVLGNFAIDAYVPALNAVIGEFRADALTAQQTLSLFAAGMGVSLLFYGALADSFGRRPVLLIALALFALASVAAALASTLGVLIAVRLLQGLCVGSTGITLAIAQDKFEQTQAQRVLAIMLLAAGVEALVAPVIGGWFVATLGWRSVFWFLAAISGVLLLLGLRVLQETLPAANRVPFRLRSLCASYLRCLRSPSFMLMASAFGLGNGGAALYIGAAPVYMTNILHQSDTDYAWLFTPLALGLMLGSAAASRYAGHIAPERLIRIGFAIAIVAALASIGYTAAFTPAVPWATLPLFLYSAGIATALPGMLVLLLSRFPDIRALAALMQGFGQLMLFALISGLLAPLVSHSAHALAWTHLGLMIAAVLAWEAGLRRDHHRPMR